MFAYSRQKKYKNVPQVWKGVRYDSKDECLHAMWLESERQQGRIMKWTPKKQYELYAYCPRPGMPQKMIGRHIPDFTVRVTAGLTEIHEVKGFKTDVWQIKRKIFESNYPHLEYKVFTQGKQWKPRVINFDKEKL